MIKVIVGPCMLFVSALLFPTSGLATTIHVPSDEPTIAAGLAAAAEGDTVEAACGTYEEYGLHIQTPGITLRSATGLPGCVTIDCMRQGRGLLITEPNVVVEGITIQRADYSTTAGVGLSVTGASSTSLRKCVVKQSYGTAPGPGIAIFDSDDVMLADVVSRENSGYSGAGVMVYQSTVTLSDCTIAGNLAAQDGGGVLADLGARILIEGGGVFNNAAPTGPEGAADGGSRITVHCVNTATEEWAGPGDLIFEYGDCVGLVPTAKESWGMLKGHY